MKDELSKGNINEVALSDDAIENQQKILHHGKNPCYCKVCCNIVAAAADKRTNDINVLVDEYCDWHTMGCALKTNRSMLR